jgi:hypothetical protein
MTGMFLALLGGKVTVTDQFFEYTTLLLPGNGTNGAQNNTFLDSSTNNFTITRNGHTTQGTFSPFSQTGWGNYFNGSNYLQTPSSTSFAFGTGNFTVEGWFFSDDTTVGARLFYFSDNADNVGINYNSTGTIAYYNGSTNAVSGTTPFVRNQWNHVAVVRSSGTVTIYVNGTSVLTQSTTYNSSTARTISIPTTSFGGGIIGYVSNFRVVKGVAVYTGNFTVPTSALTATQSAGTNISAITTGQTSLLTCQSNRFVDNGQGNTSNTPFTLTVSGSPSVVAFSPFNPSASWSAATYGGSGYFDGTGDYLGFPVSSAFTLGTNDFTIEGWLYPNTLVSGVSTAFVLDSNAYPRVMWYYVGGVFTVHVSTTGAGWDITQTCSVLVNQWNHLVLQRNGNDFRTFLNGSLAATTTASLNIPAQRSVGYVGRGDGGSQIWNGYVSGLRVVNGTAVYNTSGFTPPTSPPTAITNTSLLLNYTNGGIYDATSKNDLETVGNAQISTTQSKWGGSSMSFDGTGDYLFIPSSTINVLGTSDYTIEFWVYANSWSTTPVILEYGRLTGSVAGLEFFISNTSGKLDIYGGNPLATLLTSYTNLSTGVWTHVALSRASNTTRLFINGSQTNVTPTSVTDSTNYNLANITIGSFPAGAGNYLNGYLQDLRITKYARYTANFTPPTAAFPTL